MLMNQGVNAQQVQAAAAQAFILALQQKSQINGIRLHVCQSLSQNNFNNQKVIALVSTVIDIAQWNSAMNNIDLNTSINQTAAKMTDWYTASTSLSDPTILPNLNQQMRQEASNSCAEFQGIQNSVTQWKTQQMQQAQMSGMGMMGGMGGMGMGGMAVGTPIMGNGGFQSMGMMQQGMGQFGLMPMPVARRAGGHANAQQLNQQFMVGGMSTGVPSNQGFFQTPNIPGMGGGESLGVGVVLGVPDNGSVQHNGQPQVQRTNLAPITRNDAAVTPGRPITTQQKQQIVVPPLNVPQTNLTAGEVDVSQGNLPEGAVEVLDYAQHATAALLPPLTKAESETFVINEETLDGIVERMGAIPYPKVPKPTAEGAVKMKDVPVNNAVDLGELASHIAYPNLLSVMKVALDERAPDIDIGDTIARLRYTSYLPWSLDAADLVEMRKQLVKGAPTHAKLIALLDRILKNSLHHSPELHRGLLLEITKLANYIIRHEIGLNITIDSYALDAIDLYDDLMKRGKDSEAKEWGAAAKTISDTLLRIYDDAEYQAMMKEGAEFDQGGFAISYDIITIPVLSSQLPLGAQKPKGYKGVRFGTVYKHAHPGLHRLCTGFFAEKAVSAYKLLMTPDGRCLHVHKSRLDDTYVLTEIRV